VSALLKDQKPSLQSRSSRPEKWPKVDTGSYVKEVEELTVI
jgi:hypothetical protein